MRTTEATLYSAILLIALLIATPPNQSYAQQPTVTVGTNDIGGVVTGTNGPEAGVWVIAETKSLPTPYAKIVVTDDRGRYLIPDLPKANYSVWVRGYGLANSAKVQAEPGKLVDLRVTPAASAAADAQNYPPIYWFSLLRVPKKDEFPLQKIKSQGEWLNIVKSGACQSCHPMGTPGTRTIAKAFTDGAKTGADAWTRRLAAGSAQMFMTRDINRLDTQKALDLFGDWTDRIAAGELPFAKPQRPAGIERNVVITLWDWSQPTAYLHDAISTDRRNPRLNANGRVFGSPEDSTDMIPVLDPVTQHRQRGEAPGSGSEDAKRQGQSVRLVVLLGRQADLGQSDHQPQRNARRERPGMVDAAHPSACQSGFLQGRIQPSLCQGLPAQRGQPALVDLRSGERQVHPDRHVFPDTSSQLRERCQSDTVDKPWRRRTRRDRLAQS